MGEGQWYVIFTREGGYWGGMWRGATVDDAIADATAWVEQGHQGMRYSKAMRFEEWRAGTAI